MPKRKIIVVGNDGSGKSSLIKAIVGETSVERDPHLLITTKKVNPGDNEVTIKEPMARENFRVVNTANVAQQIENELRTASSIIVAIDMTDDPLSQIDNYMARFSNYQNKPIMFVCTKTDQVPQNERTKLQSEIQERIEFTGKKIFFTSATTIQDREFRQIREELNIANPKDQFLQKHQELLEASQQKFLVGRFRKTNIDHNWSLNDILKHAESKENRSREAFIALGWMDKNGGLTQNAPPEVHKAHQENMQASQKASEGYKDQLQHFKLVENPTKNPIENSEDQLGHGPSPD